MDNDGHLVGTLFEFWARRPRQEMGRSTNDSAYIDTWRWINRQIHVSTGRSDMGAVVQLPPRLARIIGGLDLV